ncbi:hypothetical protein [Paenibacillus sp. CF384]|uniref:hypothetical protein n=1 Tax=Paenibacillus sp. CF384 TaxID=1884382 RepID=UPI00089C141C|nr:hypothetical protein [Paenibacillus sp. CF384]SDX58057.1 hypothetical protein SAMN05518855_1016176 [Paenibacillus sp. CF384]
MNKPIKEIPSSTGWRSLPLNTLGLLAVLAGIAYPLVTWLIFRNSWDSPDFHWYEWITPIALLLGGAMSWLAAVMLFIRNAAGRDVLELAIAIVPITLAIRLLIVIVVFIGTIARRLLDGSVVDFFKDLEVSSGKLLINIALILVIITLILIRTNAKSKSTPPKENKDD